MTLELLLTLIIRPTLAWMGARYESADAERMLAAIALKESALRHRTQVGGPARSWWQFEGGGVNGVLTHTSSRGAVVDVCASLGYTADVRTIHQAMEHNDILACAMARLLLWTDAKPLPITPADGWDYYLRNWRPGKPHPELWDDCWQRASETIGD